MTPTECPMCDDGTVTVYRVNATGEAIQVCDGCDAVWEADEELPVPATTTVERYLAVRGLPLTWSQLAALV